MWVGDGPADLRDRLAAARRDRDFVRDLREIEDLSWVPGNIGMAEPAAMAGRYRTAFARYGLDVGGADPGAAADAVRSVPGVGGAGHGSGRVVLHRPGRARPPPTARPTRPRSRRVAVRAAIQAGDAGRVRALVGALDGSNVPAWFAASVGFLRLVPFEDGVRLMAAAWRAHPADYLLPYRIGQRLWGKGDDRLPEMLAWARVAVALRPDSPFPLTLLSTAWRGLHNWPEAEGTARRAVELGRKFPRYAGPTRTLGTCYCKRATRTAPRPATAPRSPSTRRPPPSPTTSGWPATGGATWRGPRSGTARRSRPPRRGPTSARSSTT